MKLRKVDIIPIVLVVTVLLALWLITSKETTVRVPLDETHRESLQVFEANGKKAAEEVCRTCHNETDLPLSETHPPKYRCMFCHKPEEAQ